MIYLSASSINNYLSCSMKHFLRVNFKGDEENTFPLRFGSLIHDVIEKEWKDYEKALKLAENLMKEYNISAQNRGKIELHLSNFFSSFNYYLSDDDKVEEEFRIKLQDDVVLLGRLDRVTPEGLVFDWKTSNSVPRTLTDSTQFIIYNYAFKKMYGKEPTGVFFASLKTGQLVKYNKDEFIEKSLFDDLIPTIINDIKSERYTRDGLFNYFSACKYCTYKEFCLGELASGDSLINEKRYKRIVRP